MENKYVVIYVGADDDLYSEIVDNLDEAMAFIDGAETGQDCGEYGCNGKNVGNQKAMLVRVEDMVTVEDYT
jgi:hypothetical protein